METDKKNQIRLEQGESNNRIQETSRGTGTKKEFWIRLEREKCTMSLITEYKKQVEVQDQAGI